jgi:hypothetical protein
MLKKKKRRLVQNTNLKIKITSQRIMIHISLLPLNLALILQTNIIFTTSDSMILITYTTIKFTIVQMRLNLSKQVKLKIILERDMCK